jgi:6-phosphogluconate dehydrogenase
MTTRPAAVAMPPALGLVGLGTMGSNFARNLARNGASLALLDADPARATALAAELGPGATATASLAALAAALPRPRAVFLLVPAGVAVDAALEELLAVLEPGDAVIDGGNSFWRDTARRADVAAARGVDFLGFGVSGGAEGALRGPAIMAGGAAGAVDRLAPLFRAVAARHGDEPCFVACGPGGAGHFVKMVHNGIEYAVMQMIAEAFVLLRDHHAMDVPGIAATMKGWATGEAGSFLLDCALRALAARDADGSPLLDAIADTASQKGTGSWAAIAALELGVPAPSLAEAVFARCLSALRAERVAAAAATTTHAGAGAPQAAVADIHDGLVGAAVSVHAQGFALVAAAAREHGWGTDAAVVARAWRAGCIIRSRLMEDIAAALAGAAPGADLLRVDAIARIAARAEPGWRRMLAAATARATPLPAFASALAHLDGTRQARSGAHLVAAQRDVFGRHGFRRLDREGSFNAKWPAP